MVGQRLKPHVLAAHIGPFPLDQAAPIAGLEHCTTGPAPRTQVSTLQSQHLDTQAQLSEEIFLEGAPFRSKRPCNRQPMDDLIQHRPASFFKTPGGDG